MMKDITGRFLGLGVFESESLDQETIGLFFRFQEPNGKIEEFSFEARLTDSIVNLDEIVDYLKAIHKKRYLRDESGDSQ